MLTPDAEVTNTTDSTVANATLLTLSFDASRFKGMEEYKIAASAAGAVLRASTEQALLYAVFEFLERQGIVFGIDGTSAPMDHRAELQLPEQGNPLAASPKFAVRGLLPWPDFWNCISAYNDEDFNTYFAAILRMAFEHVRHACLYPE